MSLPACVRGVTHSCGTIKIMTKSGEPKSKSEIERYHAKRVLMIRSILGVGIALILLARLWPGGKDDKPERKPLSTAPAAKENYGQDDFDRYNNQTFSVVKVLDGDTVDINIPDPRARKPQAYTRVRLWGIDTPEISHFGKPAMYYGYQAAEYARKLMAGRKVRLELVPGYTRDKFGRLLGYVYLPDGRLYNALAVTDGMAYAEIRFKHPKYDDFSDLESQARDNLRGLWSGITPDQLPHWYKPSRLKEFWDKRGMTVTPTPAKPKRQR